MWRGGSITGPLTGTLPRARGDSLHGAFAVGPRENHSPAGHIMALVAAALRPADRPEPTRPAERGGGEEKHRHKQSQR